MGETYEIHKVFHSVTTQHQYTVNNTQFWLHVRFHQTILRPIFIIWLYIQCVPTLSDPILFTLIKAKLIPIFNNFISKLMYFENLLTECFFKNKCKNS